MHEAYYDTVYCMELDQIEKRWLNLLAAVEKVLKEAMVDSPTTRGRCVVSAPVVEELRLAAIRARRNVEED
jgi:hypothetical protein